MDESYAQAPLTGMEIAVIGMAGRFPGAPDLDTFWRNLCEGIESISFFSEAELCAAGVPGSLLGDPGYVRAGGVLEGIDRFDAAFFGFSAAEAAITDPQQRLFLECGWQALEDAGYDSARYRGPIGVYAGAGLNTYLLNNLLPGRDQRDAASVYQLTVANDKDFLATRLSYKLNLRGPSITVQTACSTSLVAVHLACQGLLSGECDMALAGGVAIRVPHQAGYLYQPGGIASPDGHCRAFDANASGTTFGNGVGVVVLKRLADALDDGDRVLAVIKGSAINNDGGQKIGYTAPGVEGQAQVIRAAQVAGAVDPQTIGYVETHGTGTPLGDPMEVAALIQAFQSPGAKRQSCAIGSLKTNIGHLDTAAGVAGFIKTVLAVERGQLPPSLHYQAPNPRLGLDNSPFYVNTRLRPWPSAPHPRRAGVSSFGIGGTNAHVVLEQAPAQPDRSSRRQARLLLLSAKTATALETASANLARHLRRHPHLDLADVAYTLQLGRRQFRHRRALVCHSLEDAATALETNSLGRIVAGTIEPESPDRRVAFVLSGQGSEYGELGRQLYTTYPRFRSVVDECAALLLPLLDQRPTTNDQRPTTAEDKETGESPISTLQSLDSILTQHSTLNTQHFFSILDQTQYAQPRLFVLTYALAQLWLSWGVYPAAVLGHSLGELVAATLAGVFSLPDALALVARRAQLMLACPPGAMLAVPLSAEALAPLLPPDCSIAVVNGPAHHVLAGPYPALQALEQLLEAQGVQSRWLSSRQAFHSPLLERAVEPFVAAVASVERHPPQLTLLSSVTGEWLSAEQVQHPEYWGRQLREPVEFAAALGRLGQESGWVLLEVGPAQSLAPLLRRHPTRASGQVVVSSLGQAGQGVEEGLLGALGRLWLEGVRVDWEGVNEGQQRGRVRLPSYPFERERFWVEPERPRQEPAAEPVSRAAELADWFYLPSWKRTLPTGLDLRTLENGAERTWLIFEEEHGVGAQIAARLRAIDQRVVSVRVGQRFRRLGPNEYDIDPAAEEEYRLLIDDLPGGDRSSLTVIYCWSISSKSPEEIALSSQQIEQRCFSDLLFLVQALGRRGHPGATHIQILSNHLQRVAGEACLIPEKALLLGLCNVIPQEYPGYTCTSIDLDGGRIPVPAGVIDRLIGEALQPAGQPVVAYRGADRWVPSYERVHLPAAPALPPRLLQRGVFLITGAFGGLGATFARLLAQRCHARLALLARSPLPAPAAWDDWLACHPADHPTTLRIQLVRALEAAGAEVLVVQADVGEPAELEAALAAVRARFGRLHGVIHAAGVAGGRLLAGESVEDAGRVLRAKVAGTRGLLAGLAGEELEFMLLCSSLSALSGGIGQASYAAANAVLDAFAQQQSACGSFPVISINWDRWQSVGMAQRSAQLLELWGGHGPADRHPFLSGSYANAGAHAVHLSRFRVAEQWVLSEHRVGGHATMPGAAYPELIRAACEPRYRGPVLIRNLAFTTPLMVEDGATADVLTILEQRGNTTQVQVLSKAQAQDGGGAWCEHARAEVLPLEHATQARYSIAEIVGRCAEVDLALVREAMSEGMQHQRLVTRGPRWQAVIALHEGNGERLALLELAEPFTSDLDLFQAHPALLDMATGLARPLDQAHYLPFAYQSIQLHEPLPRTFYSYIRYLPQPNGSREIITCAIALLDPSGRELASIEGFSLRRLSEAMLADLSAPGRNTIPAGSDEHARAQACYELVEADRGEAQIAGMTPEQGAEVLCRVLSTDATPQIVVCTSDLQRRIEQLKQIDMVQWLQRLERPPRQRLHPRPAINTSYIAPSTELETRVAAVWQQVLGVEPIGIHDNFFEMGGDSFVGIQLITELKKEFHTDLPVVALFEAPTVAALAKQLQPDRAAAVFQHSQDRADKKLEALDRQRRPGRDRGR
jgi:phthiocerol/phenolphthiocerol synthesis type-I polyketide synthase E